MSASPFISRPDALTPRKGEDHTAANRLTYDRIAPLYLERQLQHHTTGDDLFLDLERKWLTYLPRGGRVGDLGCGPALDGERFTKIGYWVIGADLSLGMLRTAADRLSDRLVQADLRALPLASGTLAGVWCSAALLHVPDQATRLVLYEFRRVLSRSGALALITALGHGSRFETVDYADGEQRWFVYRSRGSLERMLEDGGFRIVSSEVVHGNRVWLTTLAVTV
jgi:ubiquinone/menaquinone biosynthesis C-methylase UbiE